MPPERLHQKLNVFFADMACKVFDEYNDPNSAPKEARVRDELVTPLQWMLCGRDPTVAFCSLEEHQTQANFCGKVFRGGEPAYFCKSVSLSHREGGWWACIGIFLLHLSSVCLPSLATPLSLISMLHAIYTFLYCTCTCTCI